MHYIIMTLFSPPEDREAYYRKEAQDLKDRAALAQDLGDANEAARLRDLAMKADMEARGLRNQIRDATK